MEINKKQNESIKAFESEKEVFKFVSLVLSRVHNRKREESIALAYHPCAKFSGGQVGANMSESACG